MTCFASMSLNGRVIYNTLRVEDID